MLGLPFGLRPTAGSDELLIRRIGLPDDLVLPARERVLGVVGDRVVTARRDGQDTIVNVWSIESGTEVAGAARWATRVEDAVVVGEHVIARAGGGRLAGVQGLIAISSVDGTIRWLVEPADETEFIQPYRTIGVGLAGDAVATTVCEDGMESLYDCQRTSIIDVASGAVRSMLDTGGYPVIAFSADWLLLSDHYAYLGALDSKGRRLWTLEDLVAWTAFAPNSRTILADSEGGEPPHGIAAVDPLTGSRALVVEWSGDETWHVWEEFSRSPLIALGRYRGTPCRPQSGGCDPKELQVIEGAVVDLSTGTLTRDAIHVTVLPPP